MPMITTDSGLQYEDLVVGTGAQPSAGDTLSVHYTGWLFEDGQQGEQFDCSRTRRQPFAFELDRRQVIEGWEQGFADMKVGGRRVLILPPDLAYGKYGAGDVIPPNATLKFDVELLAIE